MSVPYPIIDADGHVMEKDSELYEFLEGRYCGRPRFETYSFFPSLDGWHRGSAVPGKEPELPEMFKRDIPELLARTDLSDEAKRLILYENPKRFYGLEI